MTVPTHNNTKGLGAGVRRADRQAALAVQHDSRVLASSATTRGKKNSWSFNGNTGVWTQITVDEELGLVYLPVETPTSDFYGGHRPGQQPLRREPRGRRPEDRRAQVALPVRAPPDLELRQLLRAAPGRHRRRRASRSRPSPQPSKQALALRVRSRHRASRCGRSKSGRCRSPTCRAKRPRRRSRIPTKPPTVRAQLRPRAGRPHRLHAGAAGAGARSPEALQVRADAVQSADPRERQRSARSARIGPGTATNWPGSAYDPETTSCSRRPATWPSTYPLAGRAA